MNMSMSMNIYIFKTPFDLFVQTQLNPNGKRKENTRKKIRKSFAFLKLPWSYLADVLYSHIWLMIKCLSVLAPKSMLETGQAQDDQSILPYVEINLCYSELVFWF